MNKMTTRDRAREFAKLNDFCYWDGDYAAKFADSISSEKDLEIARLREALEEMLQLEAHTHRVPGTINQQWHNGIVADARAALSKEKA